MIYCFNKMRELRLTHIFFLHYTIALIAGGMVIAALFLLGEGLQFHSFVVLYIMYSQPAILMLRRMDYYEVKSDIKYGDYDIQEKIELSMEAHFCKPSLDKFSVFNILFLVSVIHVSILSYWIAVEINTSTVSIALIAMYLPLIYVWSDMIKELVKERKNI